MKHQMVFAFVISFLVTIPQAEACLWDRDTLKEESLKKKDVAKILQGKILKHSEYFYQEKITYTLPMLEKEDVSPEIYDEIAVAYEKLGKLEKAIETIQEKEKRFPGLYTTYANLGTFYAHQGEFTLALEYLNKAITINPDAHFGREKYQIKAIEFLQKLSEDPTLEQKEEFLGITIKDENYSPLRFGRKEDFEAAGLEEDVFVALVGMIRFGGGEKSSHLWFSLGMALGYHGDKNLAIRSLRRAELLGHSMAKSQGSILLMHTLNFQDKKWHEIVPKLDREFENGQVWVEKKQKREDFLLKSGKKKKVFGY